MPRILFVIFISQLFWNCTQHIQKSSGRVVKVSYRPRLFSPLIDPNTPYIYTVFYRGDLVMYDYEYAFDSVVNRVSMAPEYRRGYFVFHKDSSYGYFYDHKTQIRNNVRMPVEESLRAIILESHKPDSFIYMKPETTYTVNKQFREVYKIKRTSDYEQDCTAILTYDSRLIDIPETFCKKIDSAKKTKLVGLEFRLDSVYSFAMNQVLPSRTLYYNMEEVHFSANDERLQYFKKYEDSIKK